MNTIFMEWVAIPVVGGFILGLIVERYLTWWEKKQERQVIVRLIADTTAFDRAIRSLAQAARAAQPSFAEFARAMQNVGRALGSRRVRVAMERKAAIVLMQSRFGSGNRAADGKWQSDLCAAWVHGSCPLPDHCDCRCHR